MDELLIAAVAVAMGAGVLGTLVPVLPGLVLVWASALGYGLATGFGAAGWIAMAAITLVFLAAIVAKIVLPQRRAAAGGAPRSSLLVAALAGLVGFFVVPVIGMPVGAIGGLLVAERRRAGSWAPAWRSTRAAIIGFGLATLLELGAALVMAACWVGWVLATR